MIEKWFEPFMLLEKNTQPDGYGGERITFTDDAPFSGVLTWTGDTPVTVAQRPALEASPALLHEYDLTLEPGDHVRREKDGAVYKVVSHSGSLRAPAFSGLRFCQAAVERGGVPVLKTIHRELADYISGLGLPLYAADCVPDNAALPCLTLAIEAPLTPAHSGRVILTLWCHSGSAHADRLTYGDQLLTLLPPRGLWLDTGYETLLLTPEKPVQPLYEKTVLGLRLVWKLQRYPHA